MRWESSKIPIRPEGCRAGLSWFLVRIENDFECFLRKSNRAKSKQYCLVSPIRSSYYRTRILRFSENRREKDFCPGNQRSDEYDSPSIGSSEPCTGTPLSDQSDASGSVAGSCLRRPGCTFGLFAGVETQRSQRPDQWLSPRRSDCRGEQAQASGGPAAGAQAARGSPRSP